MDFKLSYQKLSKLFFIISLYTAMGCKKAPEPALNFGKAVGSSTTNGVQSFTLLPIPNRVFVEKDTAKMSDIIDNQWVAIGNKNPDALQKDNTLLFNNNYSYRFELKKDGKTRDRIELQYTYATALNYAGVSSADYIKDQKLFTVSEHGKGISPQGSKWRYVFSAFIPSSTDENATAIFAQIHGMCDRTLVVSPDGTQIMLTKDEFLAKSETMIFDTGIGYSKVNNVMGERNGWKMDTNGDPQMEMGFANKKFYISVSSDRKWATNIDDRSGANITRVGPMQPVISKEKFKVATNVFQIPFADYPKDTWVTYTMDIDYCTYNGPLNQITSPGKINVAWSYKNKEDKLENNIIVTDASVDIGRNDATGYYFKFGIYRPSSTEPFVVNMAGFSQTQR